MGTGSSLVVEVIVHLILRFSYFFSEELLATLKLGTQKVTPIPVLTVFFLKDLQRLQGWEPCRSLAATFFLNNSVCQVPALLEAGGEVKEQAIPTVLGKNAGSAGFQNRQREKHCALPAHRGVFPSPGGWHPGQEDPHAAVSESALYRTA